MSSPRIFTELVGPPTHGLAPADIAAVEEAKARGAFVVEILGRPQVVPDRYTAARLERIVAARGGSGAPTAADSATLRAELEEMITRRIAQRGDGPRPGPTQCHDITVYPEIGLAGGACEGYGATRTSPTGTRRRSTTTARRSCSPMSGAVADSPSAEPATRGNGVRTRYSRSKVGR